MNGTLVLVMGLVGLSYLSAVLGRGKSGLGLPSGSEWVVLGFLLGPDLLGVIDRSVQQDVEPVAYVAVGWVALIIGLDYGVVRSRRLQRGRIVLGALLGTVSVAVIAFVAWLLLPSFEPTLTPVERIALALGLGAAASETTSNAVGWVAERNGIGGPLSELLDDLAEAKDLAPIVVAGLALCMHPRFDVAHRAAIAFAAIPTGVVVGGCLLGIVATVMLSREERTAQSWGILMGITLLAAGTAARLRLPVVTAMFALGLALGVASRHRDRLLKMIGSTRGSAMLPALLLAGARIGPQLFVRHGLIVACVLCARFTVLFVSGFFVTPPSVPSNARRLVGWAMLPAGEVSMSIGLSFALTFQGTVGETVLLTSAVVTVVGELLGPFALRASLRRAGELAPVGAAA